VALKWRYDETCEHFCNGIEEIVGNLKPQVDFDYASKDKGSKKPMEKPLIPNEAKTRTKKKA
jgi:hypothetical protein